MSNWKFTDASNRFVARMNEDGSCESCLASVLPDGTVVAAADPVPNPRIAEIKQQLDALDFKKIRPLAAGDTEYLAKLQEQTRLLQSELKDLTK